VHPEVMALRIRISDIGAADALHFVQQRAVAEHRTAQLGPVLPTAARNHVVDGSESETLVVEVAMVHG
jgi:hypothetical protein